VVEHRDDGSVSGDAPTQHVSGEQPAEQASEQPPLSVGSLRAAPPAGTRIGKYVVERTLGVGGMGIVVAARHEHLGELVAIKLLHPKASSDLVQIERFVREARATVRIKSEHVVRVLDGGSDPDTGAPFIVMEHLEGGDLGHLLEQHGPMPVPTAVDLMLQICEAVAAAHALGIIHRDLKPSNFFVTHRADGGLLVKVLDFGISKALAREGAPDPRLTETQAVFGSPTYMSPEQIRSSKNVDARTDVWSLGVALFQMLTGKLPFIADTVPGLLASVVADAPFRVSVFAPDVPEELEAIVLACLEKDVSRRIGSAAELAMRLAAFATPEGVHQAARIERIARATTISSSGFPVGLPAPSSTHPSLPPLSAPRPPAVPSSGTAAVAFGRTGDLSATGPAIAAPRRSVVALVLGLVVFGVVCGGIGVWAVGRSKEPVPAVSNSRSAPPPASDALGAATGAPTASTAASVASANGAGSSEIALAAPSPSPSSASPTSASPASTGHRPGGRSAGASGPGRAAPGSTSAASAAPIVAPAQAPAPSPSPSPSPSPGATGHPATTPKPDPTEDRR